jgi:hypothetical protein
MRAVVVYESLYGNTRAIAEAIGEGLREGCHVTVVPVGRAGPDALHDAGLLVVGGPTLVQGMTRRHTGVREWLASLGYLNLLAAGFDTRAKLPAVLTGRASKGISLELERHGAFLVAPPESFFVTRQNGLGAGEAERARRWGQQLAAAIPAAQRGPA